MVMDFIAEEATFRKSLTTKVMLLVEPLMVYGKF